MERQKTTLSAQKHILIAPLDWGLGHATRCMPLIQYLIQHNHHLHIAGNGDSLLYLKDAFPTLTFHELPGYNITYSVGKNAAFHVLLQTPKIWKAIRDEHQAVANIVSRVNIDLIISDNRYGVRCDKVKSIFICHQIALQSPRPFQFMNAFFLQWHLQQIEKFDELWIPDEANENNLSGSLSHGIEFKIPHSYIGIQSRYSNFIKQTSFIDNIDFSILIVLSGVEPQRTYLENKLIQVFKQTNEKVLLVQGKTIAFTQSTIDKISIVSYLNSNDLFAAFQKAKSIICRSGYSTIMDLAAIGKKAILIPAQGQTEQEYLAASLANKGFAVYCKQDKLDIENALEKLNNINGFPSNITIQNPNFENVINTALLNI